MLNYRALDALFRGLADPTRRLIVERLSDGEASVSVLVEPLPISVAAMLQHLAYWRRPA
jgi:DNA-binding transcriptional ArsR family regulator